MRWSALVALMTTIQKPILRNNIGIMEVVAADVMDMDKAEF